MDELTIYELLDFCIQEVKKGNGDKKILISADDEGNAYHGLFFAFSPIGDTFKGEYAPLCMLSNVTDKTHIILG